MVAVPEESGAAAKGLHVSMAANLIANHGGLLDVAFFQDLVEEEGLLFSNEVVQHCAAHYNISPEVIQYLLSLNK